MKPGVGTLGIYPSIWGREYTNAKLTSNLHKANEFPDWAGGPGGSQDDVKWLDNKLAQFFADNKGDAVSPLVEGIKQTHLG